MFDPRAIFPFICLLVVDLGDHRLILSGIRLKTVRFGVSLLLLLLNAAVIGGLHNMKHSVFLLVDCSDAWVTVV